MGTSRPEPGKVETRHTEITAEGRKIRGLVPFGIESRDMGGWKEVIEPSALRGAKLDELIARVDHAGVPIGRFPATLDVEERSDGLHWSVTPPTSRQDLLEAIERGDLRAGSWQMVVGRDEWRGDTRHVHEISELRDVSVVSSPAYPAATVEYRAAPTTNQEDKMSEDSTASTTAEEAPAEDKTEERKAPEFKVTHEPAPVLTVEDRSAAPVFQTLTEAFRSRGFPGENATITWGEFRSLTFGGTIDGMAPMRRDGVSLGADQRYAFPAFQTIGVGSDVTSVQVLRQDSRTLAAGTAVVRAIDAVSAKPEVTTAGTLTTYTMSQVAAVETSIPNIYLQQETFNSLVETDLRLSINEGYDSLVNTGIATAGTLTAGTAGDVLTKVRKGITQLASSGYGGDTLIIDPTGAEAIDLFRSSGSELFYVFGPGKFAPGQLFGLNVRVSKTAGTAVVDSQAFGKLYSSPLTLARFEQDAGSTNKSTVRLEGHAAFGVERTTAAVRII